jgi:hypothetical protein
MNIEKLVDEFNYGDFEKFYKIFDGYENFYKFLDKRNALDKINLLSDNSSEFENSYFLYLLDHKKDLFYSLFEKYVLDFKYIDGVPYLELSDIGDLSELFCDNKNGISTEYIEDILSGEFMYNEHYSDVNDNFYEDIYYKMDNKNINSLSKWVFKSISSVNLELGTDLLKELDSKDKLYPITLEVVSILVKDEETLNFLFEEYFSEMKYDLYGIYSDSYRISYEEEVNDLVWEELSRFFVKDLSWIEEPHSYRKNVKVQKVRIRIWNFESDIRHFLREYIYDSETITYFSSYLSILSQLLKYNSNYSDFNCLSVYWPDYPSLKKLEDNFNEMVLDIL